MAQAGFTPISLYFSTSATAVPVNTNLVNGELAINITDGKLYYKDNTGVVRLLASNATSSPVISFSAGTTGLTPNTATTGAITLSGTLNVANGGTSLTTLTANNVIIGNGTSTPSFVAPGTLGNVLTSDGTTWVSSAPAGGGVTYTVKTANYTAVVGDSILADTSSGSFTITLPASPTTGGVISIVDSKGTFTRNPLIINPNGRTIQSDPTVMYISNTGFGFDLIYNGSDWRIA